MKRPADYHVHTCFSDGQNTPEEMVLSALEKGMDAIGFSDHSYTFFDESYCMKRGQIPEYRETVRALQKKYQGKIRIFCGIEQDFYSTESAKDYDYAIGSVHYLQMEDGTYVPVDEAPDVLKAAADRYFGGDVYAILEQYYETAARLPERGRTDLIGHLDVIAKYNRKTPFFEETHPRYRKAIRSAIDRLLPYGIPFEINTAPLHKGLRTEPYPAKEWISYIRERGGKLIFSSDSHKTETLCFGFFTV